MDETIVLLSSMSPKITTKSYIRTSSVLALKKNIRRSSVCDKSVRTIKNEKVCMVDVSSGPDSVTSMASKNSDNSYKVINENPIVISDTDLSQSSDSEQEILRTPEKNERPINNCLLTKEKLKEINLWIDGLNGNKTHEETKYSELSTIYGEEGENFQPKEPGNAVSSTFIGSQNKRFDELFKKSAKKVKEHSLYINDLRQSLKKFIIKDSFEDCNKSLNGDYQCNKDKNNEGSFHSAKSTQEDSESVNVQKTPTCQPEDMETEIGSLLDSIYGKKWREKQDQILPKTEPRKNHITHIDVTNSERKPKISLLYKNPYLETEQSKSKNLLEKLHRSKFKENFESPIVKKIKEICDSDTNSETSPIVLKKTKTKLMFDDSSGNGQDDEEINDKNDDTNSETSPIIPKKTKARLMFDDDSSDDEHDEKTDDEKENFDISNLGLSLEERIRKKMLKVPDVPSTTKIKKYTVKKKESDEVIKTKKKPPPLQEDRIKDNIKVHKTDESTKKEFGKIDDLSGKKEPKKSSTGSSGVSSDDEEEWDRRISTITYKKPTSGTYSFLASLSGSVPISKCDMSARIFRNNFKNFKDQLLTKLFGLYNEKVFDNSIPKETQLEWNDRMRGTAGFCHCRKITRRNGAVERSVRIALANKVIDCAERLRDTLIHEMCHAAAWIINCVSDGHGRYWKAWAFKAMKTFPELPPIKRCHDYVINTKYTYRCTGCGYSIGRHSKSLDIERKRCGHCLGKFEVLLNKVSKKGESKTVAATPKKEATGFALFVKDNYGSVKKSNLKHGEVMKILGQKFQLMKLHNNN